MFKILLINGLIIGGVYGLIALGYSLIYRASGLMSFAQGDMITLGAYLGLTFYSILRLPFFLSFILTFACAFIVGVLLEKGVIRALLNKSVLPIYIVLATIAISYIIQNATQALFGTTTLRFPQVFSTATLTISGITAQTEAFACLVISLALMFLLHLFMTKTKFGTAMRSAAMDPLAAESCGINTSMSTGITWALAAAIASIAGMLLGPMYGVYTTLGSVVGRKGFAGAVVGGYGNMYGAMVGGIILGLVETFVAGYWTGTYKNLIAYAILILFLFVKPTGIFNEKAIQDV
ncbi:MAG: High-affinity branched-chain amino acid transport system permease protein LivH [Firmicutes bacterium ADurb.Bin182]|nr:MAG: High-affinity branched-chain amino acid transport system permease protein LivH [Firmicutes bacterium ADurb.Bin182]